MERFCQNSLFFSKLYKEHVDLIWFEEKEVIIYTHTSWSEKFLNFVIFSAKHIIRDVLEIGFEKINTFELEGE